MPKRRVTSEEKTNVISLARKGMTDAAIGREVHMSPVTVKKYREAAKEGGNTFPVRRRGDGTSGPIPYEELTAAARRAYNDFNYFQLRYFGRISVPWQVESAKRIVDLEATENDEYVVVNVAPGAGKSSTMVAIACWMIVRNRGIRILYGSFGQNQAEWYTGQIRSMLTNLVPQKASPKDIELGIAVDATATLVHDFGRFKPEENDIWQRGQFYVEQFAGFNRINKEATVQAFGMDSAFIGGRYDLCIWDDVYDKGKLRSWDMKERQRSWWIDTAETRLDPAGLLVLQGQRLDPEDIYHFALSMKEGDHDEDDEVETEEEEAEVELPNKYHHVIYPAHFEKDCKGQAFHKLDAPPWPDGCLLYPRRITWRKVKQQMTNNPENFRMVYQQEDVTPEGVIVNPLWISGGTDADGIEYQGCWDKSRGIGELADVPTTGIVSYVTVDPSPTKMWGLQWVIYHGPTQHFYVMDLKRKRMTAPEFLDHDPNTGKFSGLMVDWHHRAKALGVPITYLILEQNNSQVFMTQYRATQLWMRSAGVQQVPHTTTASNKNHADYGVRTIGNIFREGRYRLPGRQADVEQSRIHSMKLVDEVTHWAIDDSFLPSFTDLTMCSWFGILKAPQLYRPYKVINPERRPSWLGSGYLQVVNS